MQAEIQRMLWRCRRGLLELDHILPEYEIQQYSTITHQQTETIDQLLDYPDNDLWALITGSEPVATSAQQDVLRLLQKAAPAENQPTT